VNAALEAQGSPQRVTRLSHAVRGIETLPQRHRGPQRPQEGREGVAVPASMVGLAFEIASGKRAIGSHVITCCRRRSRQATCGLEFTAH
ncbi:MAG TPA: hypothetical protein PLK94_14570, partial [Alphaproteobacteria bacterium]|nr:hypothetical protein [Alphaproteobacteria bacterium]